MKLIRKYFYLPLYCAFLDPKPKDVIIAFFIFLGTPISLISLLHLIYNALLQQSSLWPPKIIDVLGYVSAGLVILNSLRQYQSWSRDELEWKETLKFTRLNCQPGWDLTKIGHEHAVYSAALNKKLRDKNAKFKCEEVKYFHKIKEQIKSLEIDAKKFLFIKLSGRQLVYNAKLLGQVTDLEGGKTVKVIKTDYSQYLLTNQAWLQNYIPHRSPNSPEPVVSSDALSFILDENNKKLRGLDTLAASHTIGVSTLAITRDGYILYNTQNRGAHDDPGKIAASGSGSVDWDDFKKIRKEKDTSLDIKDVVMFAATRELLEEISLIDLRYHTKWRPVRTINRLRQHKKYSAKVTTEVAGYFRWIEKGAKPEYLCLSYIDMDWVEINSKRKEAYSGEEIEKIHLSPSEIKNTDALKAYIQSIVKKTDKSKKAIPNLSAAMLFKLVLQLCDEAPAFIEEIYFRKRQTQEHAVYPD